MQLNYRCFNELISKSGRRVSRRHAAVTESHWRRVAMSWQCLPTREQSHCNLIEIRMETGELKGFQYLYLIWFIWIWSFSSSLLKFVSLLCMGGFNAKERCLTAIRWWSPTTKLPSYSNKRKSRQDCLNGARKNDQNAFDLFAAIPGFKDGRAKFCKPTSATFFAT